MKVIAHGFIENHLQLVKTYVIVMYVELNFFCPFTCSWPHFFYLSFINVTLQFVMDLCYVYLYKQAGAELEFELRGGQNLKQEKMRNCFVGIYRKIQKLD